MTSQDYVIILLPGRVPPIPLYWPSYLSFRFAAAYKQMIFSLIFGVFTDARRYVP